VSVSFSTLAVAAAAYASTNLDNLLVLVALLAAPGLERRSVMAGHAAGIIAVSGGIAALALLPEFADPRHVGLLGLIPLTMGSYRLFALFRGRGLPDGGLPQQPQGSGFGQAFSLHVSGSADTLAVFGPLLVDSTAAAQPAMGLTFLASAAVMALAGLAIAGRRPVAAALSRGGAWTAPVIMILVGLYVLADTADDLLV
jgi:cadmium resistance protein CadD (predicted permease)